ncbi:MAG: Crp/Fnr family transcriptional regulator [Gaiellales bacterium]
MGDLPVFLGTPYAYSALTRTPVRTLRINLETVETLIEVYPEICFRWLRLLARRLERAQRRLVELAGSSAVEKLTHFLLHEAEARDSLTVALTQTELADTLALSRQTVCRALGELEALDLVERGRGRVTITDGTRLRALLPR